MQHFDQNFNEALLSEDFLSVFIRKAKLEWSLHFADHPIATEIMELLQRPLDKFDVFFKDFVFLDYFLVID